MVMVLTDKDLEKWGRVLPVLPENLYINLDKYLLTVSENTGLIDADMVVASYLQDIGDKLHEAVETVRKEGIEEFCFRGGLPMTIRSDGRICLFSGSAALKFSFLQPEKNIWFTQEQIDRRGFSLKEASNPIKILWQRRVGEKTVLAATYFYNIEDLAIMDRPSVICVENDNDWPYSLQTFTEEFNVKVVSQYLTLIKKKQESADVECDLYYRNDSFLLGLGDKYALVIPDHELVDQKTFDYLCLLGLIIFVARSRLASENKDLKTANFMGFLLACQMAAHLGNPPAYIGSPFHLDNIAEWLKDTANLTANIGRFTCLYNALSDKVCAEVVEIRLVAESLLRYEGLQQWLDSVQEQIHLQEKYEVHKDEDGTSDKEELKQIIHRSHVSYQERFKNRLETVFKQKGLAVRDKFSVYLPIIYAKFDSIMAKRDGNQYPDEEKFYQLVETVFLPGIMEAVEQEDRLVARWGIFEKEIMAKNLSDPEKDLIIRIKLKEYLNFKKNIFFRKVDSDILEKQVSKLLDSSKF
jgi:hypothetical protein